MLERILTDFRVALRALLRTPTTAVIIVLTLGLGIGVNTAMFSVVNTLLLTPLPYEDADRLYWLGLRTESRTSVGGFSDGEFLAIREMGHPIEQVSFFRWGGGTLTEPDGRPGENTSHWFGPGMQEMLGVEPLLGRRFSAEDSVPGAAPVVALGEQTWRRVFQGDPDIVGKQVEVDGRPHEVVAVFPEDFQFPYEGGGIQINRPFQLDPERAGFGWGGNSLIARFAADATPEQVGAALEALSASLAERHPETNSGRTFIVYESMTEEVAGDTRGHVLLLWGAVSFLLLLACINVANLMLARAFSRRGESAVAAALGSPRRRIVQRVFIECLVVAGLGTGLGLLVAQWAVEGASWLGADVLPRSHAIAIDLRVMVFTVLLGFLAASFCSVIPAIQLSRVDIAEALKDGGQRVSMSRGMRRLRLGMTIAEIAISFTLLIGAGLMLRTTVELHATDPGLDYEQAAGMMMWLDLPQDAGPEWLQQKHEELRASLLSVPGVTKVAQSQGLPWEQLFKGSTTKAWLPDRPSPDGSPHMVAFRFAGPDYFDALAIRVLEGRSFTRNDDPDAAMVIVVNRSFVEQYADPEDDAASVVGREIELGEQRTRAQIVGIVENIRDRRPRTPAPPMIFFSPRQWGGGAAAISLIAQFDGDPATQLRAMQESVWKVLPDQGIWKTASLAGLFRDTLARERLFLKMLAIFAVLSVLMAATGLYGVLSYNVAQRTKEIGIRMALGAGPERLLRSFLAEGLWVAAIGIGCGLPLAILVAQALRATLYGVGLVDPATYVGVIVLLVVISAAAALAPALRATRVEPALSLRSD